MFDWGIVARVAGGGFGTTIVVLVVLCVIAWVIGLILKRTTKTPPENKQNSK